MRTKVWTGGTMPASVESLTRQERHLVSYLFRQQFSTFVDYWEEYPDRDTQRIFWRRARFDAHATLNQ